MKPDNNPNEAARHHESAVELLDQKKWQDAILECDEAIRLDTGFAKAYKTRGDAYDELDQSERAIKDYDESIRLDPESSPAYFNRGNANS